MKNKKNYIIIGIILVALILLLLGYFLINGFPPYYKLKTDKITISEMYSIGDEQKKEIEITDKDTINEIIKLCNNGKFRSTNILCKCVAVYCIDFNNEIQLNIHAHEQGGPAELYVDNEQLSIQITGELYKKIVRNNE